MHCIPHRIDRELVVEVPKLMGNKKEPTYTASIVLSLAQVVENVYRSIKPNIRTAGCYVHQKPKVSFVSRNNQSTKILRRELGDLLVVVRDMIDGEERYNAALFQLKKRNGDKVDVESGQCELLRDWPPLWFKNVRNVYDITPKHPSPGAQYMIVDNSGGCDWPLIPFFWVAPPKSKINPAEYDRCAASFGHYLDGLVNWRTGRPIHGNEAGPKDEWSRLVWDIIDDIKDVSLNNLGVKSMPNGQTRICSDMSLFLQNYSLPGELKKLNVWNGDDICDADSNHLPEGFEGFGFVYIDLASQYRD